jgi:putative hydrolase of HD superfamily
MATRLEQQIQFLVEIDKVKQIFRRTRLFDRSRYENDAEHAWHLGMMAIVLAEHANEPGLDVAKIVKMVLIHDLVEIDTGDLFLYDAAVQAQKAEAEPIAARRIFGLLPEDQRDEFFALWDEFESRQTPEAKFAAALDRLEPILQNHRDEGHSWQKHGVTADRVHAAVKHIEEGSATLWGYTQTLLDDSVNKGWLTR